MIKNIKISLLTVFIFAISLTVGAKSILAQVCPACGDDGNGCRVLSDPCTTAGCCENQGHPNAHWTNSCQGNVCRRDAPLNCGCGGCPTDGETGGCDTTPPPPPPNQTPIGSHDGFSGTQSAGQCRAYGWAVDPDNTDIDLQARISIDSSFTITVPASGTAPDCSGQPCTNFCPGGTCAFNLNLNGVISPGFDHTILVEAQDAQFPAIWQPLANSPKRINCSCSVPGIPTITAPNPVDKKWNCNTNSITFSWNPPPGAPPAKYAVRIDQRPTPSDVSTWRGDCDLQQIDTPGDYCDDNYTAGTSITRTVTPGLYYAYWVHAINSCGQMGPKTATNVTGIPVSSINVLPPGPTNLQSGSPQTFTAQVLPNGALISDVTFGVATSQPGVLNVVGSSSDSFPAPYDLDTTAGTQGTATVGASANLVGTPGALCSDNSPASVSVTAAPAWWQVRGGDVTTYGNLRSILPGINIFNLAATGVSPVYPGINVYNGSANFGPTGSAGPPLQSWLLDANGKTERFDYAYFDRQIPADAISKFTELKPGNAGCTATGDGQLDCPASAFQTLPGPTHRGYRWFKYDATSSGTSDLNISAPALANRRIILFVKNANLKINGRINLASNGTDYFMAIVNGNIMVDSAVTGTQASPALEGLYVADGQFSTGFGGLQFAGRGSFVAYGGFNFDRGDMPDNSTTPAEFFEYGPEMVVNLPPVFTSKKVEWQEVAP